MLGSREVSQLTLKLGALPGFDRCEASGLTGHIHCLWFFAPFPGPSISLGSRLRVPETGLDLHDSQLMVLADLPGCQVCPSHGIPHHTPPALAWFPSIWSGFSLPQGGFPANARAARARACPRPYPRGPVAAHRGARRPEPASSPNPRRQTSSSFRWGMTDSNSPLAKISSYDHSPLSHHALRCYISSRCCRPRVLRRLAAPLDER